jgi:hypothetical protein
VNDPNSFRNPEFLKDLEFINDQLSSAELRQQRRVDNLGADDFADPAERTEGAVSSLKRELEQACLATGAAGAAIALVQGKNVICSATAGSHVPDIGVSLDPHKGLSGCCFQTRELQNCTDTETDSRVDPEASRRLGVRSIVVLPLINGDDLFGIVEMFSSQPNAFGEHDLDTIRGLAERIVERKRKAAAITPIVARKESSFFTNKVDTRVSLAQIHSLDSALRGWKRISRRNDLRGMALGTLVIAAAMLLGALVGWRLGWRKATLGFRSGSSSYRSNVRDERTDHTMFSTEKRQPSLVGMAECGQSKPVVSSAHVPSGGLTVSQEGRVIFRLSPAAATSNAQGLPTAPTPPEAKVDTIPQ